MKIFTKLYENNTMVKEGHSPSMKTLVASVFLVYPSDGWASASE
jgi:hypothetical protein